MIINRKSVMRTAAAFPWPRASPEPPPAPRSRSHRPVCSAPAAQIVADEANVQGEDVHAAAGRGVTVDQYGRRHTSPEVRQRRPLVRGSTEGWRGTAPRGRTPVGNAAPLDEGEQ